MSKAAAAKWTRADFRLHLGHVPSEPHWLLRHPYGRALLASELRRVRPDLDFSVYAPDDALVSELDRMIDRLALRKLPRPRGCREQLGTVGLILRTFWRLEMSLLTAPL